MDASLDSRVPGHRELASEMMVLSAHALLAISAAVTVRNVVFRGAKDDTR